MEDEELNEEVMGDPDAEREVTDDVKHDEVDAGVSDEGAEEPASPMSCNEEPCATDFHLQEEIDHLKEQVSGLMDSIALIIQSGAVIQESEAPMGNTSEEDEEQPYVRLEDMDFNI